MASRTNIFISYARSDSLPLAKRLCDDLRAAGYPVWLDLSEIAGGASWSERIERAIEECDLMLALMSPASYNSQWCRAEQLRAIRKGKRMIPLLAVTGAEPPLHLEHLNYLNFTDTTRYSDVFSDLLTDIRAAEAFLLPSRAADPQEGSRRAQYKPAKSSASLRSVTRPAKRNAPTFRRYLRELQNEKWLGARFWWPYFLFHYVDVHTLVTILKTEELLAPFHQGAQLDNKWDRYVKLYFRPRTPDLFFAEGFRPGVQNSHGYAPIPVYLLFDLEALLCHPQAQFSYGDPAKTRITYKTPNLFKEMPFERIYHDSWFVSEEKEEIMRCREAQVIIPEKIGLESLQLIWLRSEAEYETLHSLLPPELWKRWRDKITARTDYHLFNHRRSYVQTAALTQDHILFRFNPPLTERDGGMFSAEITVEYADGTHWQWYEEGFQPNSDLRIDLPANRQAYNVRFTLDSDVAYVGRYRAEHEVL